MRNASNKRVRTLRNAIRATIEGLETRVHLDAGQLDWSYGTGAGYILQSQALPDVLFNPNPDDFTVEDLTWDLVPATFDREIVVHDAAVDAGGRVVVAGEMMGYKLYSDPERDNTIFTYFDRDFMVARYRKDGTLEGMMPVNFGHIGNDPYPPVQAFVPSKLDDRAYAIVIEPEFLPDGVTRNPRAGQLVLGGRKGGDIPGFGMGAAVALARYTLTSNIISRDDTFGEHFWNREDEYDGPEAHSVTEMALQAVGNEWKYVVVGSVYNSLGTGQDFAVWRFNGDGTLDTTFGALDPTDPTGVIRAGYTTTAFQSYSNDEITGVLVQPDGKIVVSGYSDDRAWNDQLSGAHDRMLVGRYNADGTADSSFGSGGFTEIDAFGGKNARGNAVMRQADGRIVVVGSFDQYMTVNGPDGTSYDSGIVARLNVNGQIDESFGTRGRLVINSITPLEAWRAENVAEQSDGKLIVSGTQAAKLDAVRLSANGQLDQSYGVSNNAHFLRPAGPAPAIPGSESIPSGLRATRTTNLEGRYSDVFQGYHYDTPVLVLGKGEDVDKAYLIGNYAVGAGALSTAPYGIVRVQGDNSAPTAILQAQNVELEQENATSYTFRVTYNDNVLMSRETLGLDDVVVIGPGGSVMTPIAMAIIGYTPSIDADGNGMPDHRTYTVDYTITPPGGTWNPADNGLYTVRLRENQVTDIEGTPVYTPLPVLNPGAVEKWAELGNFIVNIAIPDTTAPTAVAPDLANNLTVGGRLTYRFEVEFREAETNGILGIQAGENVAVGTLTNNRVITVIGPNSYRQNARFVSVSDPTDGQLRTATYEIDAPGGIWDFTDQGTYFFNINANVVSDDYLSPNYIQAAELGRLEVAIVVGQDVRPTAQRVDILDDGDTVIDDEADFPPLSNQLITGRTAEIFFLVKYEVSSFADPASVLDRNTIVDNNLAVRVTSTLPAFNRLATFEQIVAADASDKWIVVQYSITPLDQSWDQIDSGTYAVTLEPNQIADQNDPSYPPSFIPSTALGTITVNIADEENPTYVSATLPAPTVGASSYSITVVYTDDMGINPATIGTSDIVINRSANGTNVTLAPLGTPSVRTLLNGDVEAIYSFTAPNGMWDYFANGTYTVTLRANEVRDTAGKPVVLDPSTPVVQNIVLGTFEFLVEDLEIPTATVQNPVMVPAVGGTNYVVTVVYSDDQAINVSTIDANDILVQRVGLPAISLASAGAPVIAPAGNGTPRLVTYTFTAPGGVWNQLDNGQYNIIMVADQVRDGAAKPVAAGTLGSFTFADLSPVATAAFTPITAPGLQNFVVTVTYTDEVGVDWLSIGENDITVSRIQNGTAVDLVLLPAAQGATNPTVDVQADGTPRIATYTFQPLGGYWESDDNGVYVIRLNAGTVTDTGDVANEAAQLALFAIDLPVDQTIPVARVVSAPVLNSEDVPSYSFEVEFTDNVAIDLQSVLNGLDFKVFGMNQGIELDAVLVPGSVSLTTSGTPMRARYVVEPQNGIAFTSDDNGTWVIRMQANSVTDVSGNAVGSGPIGNFTIAVPDDNPPTAEIESGLDSPIPLSTTHQIVVVYTDGSGIDLTSINAADIVVTNSAGVTLASAGAPVAVPMDTTNTQVRVTYTFNAPGGTWNFQDVGDYEVTLAAGEIRDIAAAATDNIVLGTFTFVDDAPSATVLPPTPIVVMGNANVQITVEYADDVLMDDTTFDANDIEVSTTKGDGTLVKLVSANAPVATQIGTSGAVWTVTYTFLPPGGFWEPSDTGTYAITLLPNQVADGGGQFAAGAEIGSFEVDLGEDTSAPEATLITAPTLVRAQASYDFVVRYTDETGVDYRTITSGDVLVTGPNGQTYTGTLRAFTPASFSGALQARYRITKPGGFNAVDNGIYTVTAVGNQVSDVSGNFIADGTEIGTFVIANPVPPVSAVLASVGQVVQTATSTSFQVTYSSTYALDMDTIIGNNTAVRVTGPKAFSAFATYVGVNNPADGLTRTVTYRIAAPGGAWDFGDNGVYTISIVPNNGIRNIAGGTVAAGNLGTFIANTSATILEGTTLRVTGTDESDTIELIMLNATDSDPSNDVIQIVVNNVLSRYDRALVRNIVIDALAGNDTVNITSAIPATLIRGGTGNDTLWGGDFNDTIFGDDGDDYIVGGYGADSILGGNGNDRMVGTAGADTIVGQGGNDNISGGNGNDRLLGGIGNDTLTGGKGRDYMSGDDGDDWFFARDSELDSVLGGAGNDRGQIDVTNVLDVRSDVEMLLA